MILFPINEKKKLRKGEATEEERKLATQYKGPVMPIKNAAPEIEYRELTDKEKKFSAFKSLRQARTNAKLCGIRAKKAREAAEAQENAPGKK